MSAEAARADAWAVAARLVARWLDRRDRIDELLETADKELRGAERATCQHLVFGVVRHCGRLEAELERLIAHPPRFETRAVLLLAGFELLEMGAQPVEEGKVAKIIHHAVERTKTLTSPAEARLVNAVGRKLAAVLAAQVAPPKIAEPAALADYFSHPEWLVRRWLATLGAADTRALLEWNQQPAKVYARWRGGAEEARPAWLKPTAWTGFFEVPSGRWPEVEPLLKAGKIYLQDPGTRLAVELLAPRETEVVLDACAAPGGKSLLIADTMQHGKLIAVDLPGVRIPRLAENLSRLPATVGVALVQADLFGGLAGQLKEHGLPRGYRAVLLDVPCSNTGVMRHRADVKWRLQEGDFAQHARQQLALLSAAAKLVPPSGRLVYSTCSIDPVENEEVVKKFLTDRVGQWEEVCRITAKPWETGHDGAGVFLLRRSDRQFPEDEE